MDVSGSHDPQFQPQIIEPLSLEIPNQDRGEATLIAQADRYWKAEEANATRLATRANLVLTGITAVLGLKLYTASKELDLVIHAPTDWRTTGIFVLGAVGLILLFFSLGIALGFKLKATTGPACKRLQIRSDLAERPWRMTKRQADWYVFKICYSAALDLHERNRKRSSAIDMAQGMFFTGIFLLFVCLGLYTSVAQTESRRLKETGSGRVDHPTQQAGYP